MRIENCAMEDVRVGDHTDFGPDTIIIQITDPAIDPPIPKYKFKAYHCFEFLDIDDSDIAKHPDSGFDEFAITEDQAKMLVEILKEAKEMNRNVVVHCHAGVCRSGAVVEVAEAMGFKPTNRFRAPNLRVKHLMMKALGWTYDSEEKPYMVNTEPDIVTPTKFGLW